MCTTIAVENAVSVGRFIDWCRGGVEPSWYQVVTVHHRHAEKRHKSYGGGNTQIDVSEMERNDSADQIH